MMGGQQEGNLIMPFCRPNTAPRRQDEWDEEYDRGRTKKVKTHGRQGADAWDPHGNAFQRSFNQRQRQQNGHSHSNGQPYKKR